MKPIFDVSRLCAVAALASLLGACGQKGPLYLPAEPPVAKPVEAPQPIPTAPTPTKVPPASQ